MINIEFKTLSDQELRELIVSAKEELKSRQEAQPKQEIPRVLRQMYMETLGTDRDSTVTRYNGGWAKTVRGLDKSKTNGYSILGDFVDIDAPQYWKNGTIILDCDINGSRKHPEKTYRLFRYENGKLSLLAKEGDTKDWAVRLWPAIEEALDI
jgi:hypothetical protein